MSSRTYAASSAPSRTTACGGASSIDSPAATRWSSRTVSARTRQPAVEGSSAMPPSTGLKTSVAGAGRRRQPRAIPRVVQHQPFESKHRRHGGPRHRERFESGHETVEDVRMRIGVRDHAQHQLCHVERRPVRVEASRSHRKVCWRSQSVRVASSRPDLTRATICPLVSRSMPPLNRPRSRSALGQPAQQAMFAAEQADRLTGLGEVPVAHAHRVVHDRGHDRRSKAARGA